MQSGTLLCRIEQPAAALGLDEVSAPAGSPGGANLRCGLFGTAGTRFRGVGEVETSARSAFESVAAANLLREYDKLARQCAAESLDSRSFLQQLCELELLDREQRATERRIKAAKFPVTKSLDTFDFPSLPALNKKLVLELARCEFIDRRENVLALGNSGTGLTHIGLALGLAACQRGYRTRFTTAAALVNELLEARDERRLLRCQKQLAINFDRR